MTVNPVRQAATNTTSSGSKPAQLRALLTSPNTEFIMEAHDGLSAKIVEEAGFSGIWASGLTISAALGVRDNNEASWTQVLEVLEFMSDASSIPMLVDGDTGYGNFNNVRRVVKKLCQRGIAGICIEDKLFPKTNSFIGDSQPLADIDEFCGKIKAGKDSQDDPDFNIVARIEALISGRGMLEALKRANAYYEAGADALLIHSKQTDGEEILTFVKEWGNRCPVIIVPTTYYETPTEAWRNAGVSMVIWANHNLRASITAMREVSSRIMRDQSLIGVENEIATVKDIFKIAGNAELAEAEKLYLPESGDVTHAIILAASRGIELGDLTADRPKCMVDVRGQPILGRLVDTLNSGGIRDVTVIRGYRKEMVNLPAIEAINNDNYDQTGEAATLACAEERIEGEIVIAYGDTLFRQYVLDVLARADGDVVLVVDALWKERDPVPNSRIRDLVSCSSPFATDFLDEAPITVETIGPNIDEKNIDGEWIGLARFDETGSDALRRLISDMRKDGTLDSATMIDLFCRLQQNGTELSVVYITGHWLDVDNLADLGEAETFL